MAQTDNIFKQKFCVKWQTNLNKLLEIRNYFTCNLQKKKATPSNGKIVRNSNELGFYTAVWKVLEREKMYVNGSSWIVNSILLNVKCLESSKLPV